MGRICVFALHMQVASLAPACLCSQALLPTSTQGEPARQCWHIVALRLPSVKLIYQISDGL